MSCLHDTIYFPFHTHTWEEIFQGSAVECMSLVATTHHLKLFK